MAMAPVSGPVAKRVKIVWAEVPGAGMVWQCAGELNADGQPTWTDYPPDICAKLEKVLADGPGTGVACDRSIKYGNNKNEKC